MKNILYLLLFIPFASSAAISDSLHVKHYSIYFNEINISQQTISGYCDATMECKVNNTSILKLTLLNLTVDSVVVNAVPSAFIYDDTLIQVPVSPMIVGDTITCRIYYHGSPVQDASGWGGFYFNLNHAFNMGVGFSADPHNYGKAWFPCIDEFTDKSTYDFYITTASSLKAVCNGILMSSAPAGSNITWHWKMNQPIPSYLASIAVAPYYTLQRTSNNIPVEWACMQSDTNAILNTFQHLDTVLSSFITAYGPYPFDKVGYTLVPFNSGAMEHATSIHIGSGYMSGLTYETLWAHELSHMWWGDKVTCATAQDMWLNEGFASYNEGFITEKIYGKEAYRNWIRTNHRKVLQFAHINDGSYFAMNNIPHDYTYGNTVYNKGADVIHTLRNYMGDSSFFVGCTYYMNNRAFGNATSAELRDDLTTASGISMNRFFDDWIFTEGFPHFSIDSVVYYPGGLDHYFVYVRQKNKGNSHVYSMPVEINFSDGIQDTTVTVVIDSVTQMFHIPLFMVAQMITIDREEKISDAITSAEKWITGTGNTIFPETYCSLNTLNSGNDSSLVRAEYNWVAPDGWKQPNPGIRISDYHYWRTDGIISNGYHGQFTFSYNGSTTSVAGYLDNSLITGTEDSLVLLYRSGTGDDWQVIANALQNTGVNHNDKIGSFKTDSLRKGEYTFGYRDYTVTGVKNTAGSFSVLNAYPNPSNDTFNLVWNIPVRNNSSIRVMNAEGKQIKKIRLAENQKSAVISLEGMKKGIYIAVLSSGNEVNHSVQLVLN